MVSQSFSDHFENYEQWMGRSSLSTHTKRSYLINVRRFIEYLSQCQIEFENLNAGVFLQYRDNLKYELGLSPSSINNSLAAIEHFFRFLNNSVPRIEREIRVKATPRTFSKDELERFLKVVRQQSKRDQSIIDLLLYAGLRVSECAALNADAIEVTDHTAIVTVGAKNKCIVRRIPVNGIALETVVAWLGERARLFAHSNNPALFLTGRGERLSIAGINFLVKSLGWKARLVVSPQVLRNTCLKSWLVSVNDVPSIATLAGHKSLDTTLRYVCDSQPTSAG
jgi:site-specific recombinase XerD